MPWWYLMKRNTDWLTTWCWWWRETWSSLLPYGHRKLRKIGYCGWWWWYEKRLKAKKSFYFKVSSSTTKGTAKRIFSKYFLRKNDLTEIFLPRKSSVRMQTARGIWAQLSRAQPKQPDAPPSLIWENNTLLHASLDKYFQFYCESFLWAWRF